MDCPPRAKAVAVVERWTLVELGFYKFRDLHDFKQCSILGI